MKVSELLTEQKTSEPRCKHTYEVVIDRNIKQTRFVCKKCGKQKTSEPKTDMV